jgi:protocatechuate 3,4-dioxygenase beta subunit
MAGLRGLGLAVAIGAISAVRAASLDGYVRAANVNEHVEDVRVNIGDQRTVNLVTAFAVTDPDGTTHTLKIDGDLSLKAATLTRSDTLQLVRLDVVSSKGGKPQVLSTKFVEGLAGTTTAVNFSICGDRTIRILGGTNPGRCAELPPMGKSDPQFEECGGFCTGPYEGMPAVITSHARIAPVSEPGEPLTITGRVVGPDGHPRAGIIVYAYHTNRLGLYPPPVPPRSEASYDHGQLRGWARTDADGRYVFDTIRPGSYPHTRNPQHVHMHIIEPGCSTYVIKEIQFSDDPARQQLNEQDRKRADDEAAVVTPRKTAQGWQVTRDIRLGENVKGYKPCAAARRERMP